MPRAFIELELYGEDNEIIKKLSRAIAPWGTLKKAVRLSKRFGKKNADEIDEEVLDEMAAIVIEIFGQNNVTKEELESYADVGDMMNVIRNIAARGQGLIPNAPPAA